ncbi:siderophore-interacting protein [Kitasatospora sp. CB02891]|uniref:siderophore-interacting protein n=1 Tax=Kitasatospora sp. CB02891 TaxID=2020329 RepID=UPI000C273A39|nr:siderophore-interacting protein [Kitasatospora sp. CB02891]PJN23257.1 NADPH-dependent ferric siderophore reductase [Kitasatospora sp. CB02891]
MTGQAQEFAFFPAQVVGTCRLGPTMLRVTFGGAALAGFASGGRDQSCSLFLPHPGQPEPLLPHRDGEGWFAAWRALPASERAVMRSYTVRARRAEPPELDVDFALHGTDPDDPSPAGPAARWAAAAAPGDRVVLLGPAVADNRSVGFRPPEGTRTVLLLADETALPAVGGILEWLPAGARALVWIEVPDAADIQDLSDAEQVDITWLIREPGAPSRLLTSLREAELPADALYAWIAGEAGTVKALRRHLVRERGLDRRAVSFAGYWRRGASEDRLREEAYGETS